MASFASQSVSRVAAIAALTILTCSAHAAPSVDPDHCKGSITAAPEAESHAGIMDAAIAWWRSKIMGSPKSREAWNAGKTGSVVCEVIEGGKTHCVEVGHPCPAEGLLPHDEPNLKM